MPFACPGRRNWPEAVRKVAVQKIGDGATVVGIAAELGTARSVVARWLKESRAASAQTPAFVELVLPKRVPAAAPAKRIPGPSDSAGGVCRVRLGGAEFNVPAGYPAAHLAKIIRAVKATA